MTETVCPRCGESVELRGRVRGRGPDSRIEVECMACGHSWDRGALRCRACGGMDSISMRQQMTRHPRGTLLAVTGVREVQMCPQCDAEVVDGMRSGGRAVPDGYVSRFVYGVPADPSPSAVSEQSTTGRSRRSSGGPPSTVVAAPSRAAAAGLRLEDPTVRQATEQLLEATPGAVDSVALVLWGQRVGAATRLSQLDTERVAHDLEEWVTQTWRHAGGAKRKQVVTTFVAASDYWRTRGWMSYDLAAGLR